MYNRLIRQAKSTYYGNLFDSFKGNIAGIWRTLNDIIGKSNDKSYCAIINKLLTDKLTISNAFCPYFTTVGKKCAKQIPPSEAPYTHHLKTNMRHSLFFTPVSSHDIISIISKLKGKKSTGHDNISSFLLKSIKGEIAYPLSIMVNSSLATGIVPDTLKLARVLPLFKAKDHQLVSNYRPISLLPAISKVLEKIVHHKLY